MICCGTFMLWVSVHWGLAPGQAQARAMATHRSIIMHCETCGRWDRHHECYSP